MGIQTQSALIASILLLAIALNVMFQRRSVLFRWSFAWLVLGLFLYNLFFFLWGVSEGAELWMRLLLISAALASHFGLRFFSRFLGEPNPTALAMSGLATVATVVIGVTRVGTSSWFTGLVATFALGSFGYIASRLFARHRKTTSEVESARFGYLFVGHLVALTFAGLDLLPMMGTSFPSLGHLLTTLYMYFWMQIVQRSRLLDLEELFGRGLGLLILSVPMSLIYGGLVVWAGDRTGLFFFNSMLASVVLIFLFEPMKDAIDQWIGRLLFRETFEFEAILGRLRAELPNHIHVPDQIDMVLDGLNESRRVTHASVLLLDSDGRGYSMQRSIGPLEARRVDVVRARAFLEALRRDRVLALEQVDRERDELPGEAAESPQAQRLDAIRGTMRELSAGLSFALVSGERMLGFLNLKDERLREPFSSAEIRLILSLAGHMATALENSEHFERLKERERLSALGEMSAGLAHEIRNPLGAIKGAGQLLDPAKLDPEQRDMVEVILAEVDRLNEVVSQFLDYARPYRGAPQAVELNPLLERVGRLLRAQEHASPVEVRLALTPNLPAVRADPAQLEQVFLNLARNALEAMEGGAAGGVLTMATEVLETEGPTPRVQVRFVDTGPGIPDEVLRNLFIPFFTTKRKGTGLGLAICQRIVQNHGGTIAVRTQLGQGTTVTIRLRRADEPESATGEFDRALLTNDRAL
ncbi:ATP-binding protein [Myxococcota bacterium]|nr:ATP-binding protein [Myxococcota bacterium]